MANTDAQETLLDAPAQLPPTTTATTTTTGTGRTKSVKQWRCDCCRLVSFADFQEACQHEEECRRRVETEQTAQPAVADKAKHAFFQPAGVKKRKAPDKAATTETTTKTATAIKKVTIELVDSAQKTTAFGRISRSSRSKLTATTTAKPDVIELLDDSPKPPTRNKTAAAKTTTVATHKKKRHRQHQQTAAASVASFFGGTSAADQKALLAEQVAVEFAAQRRLEQQRQRERQQKRNEKIATITASAMPAFAGQQETTASGAATTSTSARATLATNKAKGLAAPRFPVPSHTAVSLIEPVLPEPVSSWLSPQHLARAAKKALIVPTTAMKIADDCANLLPAPSSPFAIDKEQPVDPLWHALTAVLVPPLPTRIAANVAEKHTLWAEKYAIRDISNDICSHSLQQVATQLREFCQQWMVERQKANDRAAARQKKLQSRLKHKKKATKKQTYYDDDDFMDSEQEEEMPLESLCVLTGPVASGKSSLVHAVAAACDCQVLEITTADKRGHAAVKRVLEEATQSLSSLDMLKQQGRGTRAVFGKATPHELVDSDDNEDAEKGSAVTIVLIDEVDNLYEAHGDSGFWTALSELTKRAKCPIFLTCNVLPENLNSSAFRYKHFDTALPTPAECVSKMRQMMDREGFTICKGLQSDRADQRLALVAELCQCDLRRIAHELQLYSRAAPRTATNTNEPSIEPVENIEQVDDSKLCETVIDCRPRVTELRPRSVASEGLTLLTISGFNFMYLSVPPGLGSSGYPVTVLVGNQKCPLARIMDDSTILAVALPCRLGANVASSGVNRGTHQRSLAASYAPVSIQGSNKTGIISTSSGSVTPTVLPDDSKIASLDAPVILEYHFPIPKSKLLDKLHSTPGNESEEEEEFEFTEDSCPVSNVVHVPSEQPALPQVDYKLVARILKDGIDAWASKNNRVASVGREMDADPVAESTLEALAFQRQLVSDAALFEDCGLVGMPFLSGACRGFGFNLTDAYPKSTNSKSKCPSEDRLFASGWKDDCFFYGDAEQYMTHPTTLRERMLLKRSGEALRGFSLPRDEAFEAPEDDDDYKFMTFDRTEEGVFLSNPSPTSLLSLPFYLKNAAGNKSQVSPDLDLLDSRKIENMHEMTELLASYLFVIYPLPAVMFSRGIAREVDPLLPSVEMIDRRLFLEYLPILRGMSVQERAAGHIYDVAHASDPDAAASLSNRVRHTRRNKAMGRVHYLGEVSAVFTWDTIARTAKDVGRVLAESLLVYKT